VKETAARGSVPVWRRDDDTGPLGLRLTDRGLAAIGVQQGHAAQSAGEPPQAEDGRRGPSVQENHHTLASRDQGRDIDGLRL